MFKNILPFAFLIIICSSCSHDPVKVVFDKKDLKTGKIKIDNKDQYNFNSKAISLKLMPGKHSFILNNEPSKDFTVGDNGGMLNLDNQEYVAYEVEYTDASSQSTFSMNSMKMKAAILIDSFVIIPKAAFGKQSDSSLKNLLPQLQQAKNGNYFFGKDYDTNGDVQGLKKFGKDKLFIDGFWDYAVGEDIPKTLTVTTQKNSFSIGRASTTRVAVMHAHIFLFAAMMAPEEYTVKSIATILAGEEDKANEEIKKKSQMKF